MYLTDDQLNLWFKDQILGDVTDPKNYLSQTVNIDVKALLSVDDFSRFVALTAGDITDKVYKEVGQSGMSDGSGAYIFYAHLLSLSNRQKLEYLYKTIGD